MEEMIPLLFIVAFAVVMIAAMWKVFEKAGKPGWAAIIPIYNMWVMAEIAGKPGWFGLLTAIPLVGIIFAIIIVAGVGTAFGKSGGFIVGMIFLPFIFYPILGFGDARYGGARPVQRGFTPVMPGQQQQYR